jgi:hypothetical protein
MIMAWNHLFFRYKLNHFEQNVAHSTTGELYLASLHLFSLAADDDYPVNCTWRSADIFPVYGIAYAFNDDCF